MKPLKDLCTPLESVFDVTRRDTVLDLSDLAQGNIDARQFFRENYLTEGMKALLVGAFRRLQGKSSQGLFKLTQASRRSSTSSMRWWPSGLLRPTLSFLGTLERDASMLHWRCDAAAASTLGGAVWNDHV